MPGPAPNPNARRQNKQPEWVELPPGRAGDAPKLPALRRWNKLTRAAWVEWWSSPQASQWDQTGKSLHRWAFLFDCLVCGDGAPAAISAQMQALEDRHGFSPKAMRDLRWRLEGDERAEDVGAGSVVKLRAV